jgi:clan AA aspartic protease (TIGR02281 family)
MKRSLLRSAAVAWLLAAVLMLSARSEAQTDVDDLLTVMERLAISVPMSVAGRDPIKRHLGELNRERCDQQAIADLGEALDKAGYRREAATAHIRFSATCGGHATSLRRAVNVLLRLSDYAAAERTASSLIALEPFNDNGYFLRALANDRGGMPQKAIDDYVTAIELYPDKQKISSFGYLALARSHEKLGRFCDAMQAVETWVLINPARNDNGQTRAMISDYSKKGSCEAATGKDVIFNLPRPANVVNVQATVNGVRSNFILDTGATFVSLKPAFAQKAKVQVDQDSTVKLRTANGIVDAKRGRAAVIQLRSLQAKDVPIVVQEEGKDAFGGTIDGLLGMSFLSRFNVAIDKQTLKISTRK